MKKPKIQRKYILNHIFSTTTNFINSNFGIVTRKKVKMNKTKIFTLVFMTAILLSVGMVSAVVTYTDSGNEITIISKTTDHNAQISVSFKLENEHTSEATDIQITPTDLTDGSKTISASKLALSNVPSTIAEDGESGLITLTIDVPEFQESGTYTGKLEGIGEYTGSIDFDLNLKVIVKSESDFTVSEPTTLLNSNDATFTITNTGNTVLTTAIVVKPFTFDGNVISFEYPATKTIQPNSIETITINTQLPANFPLSGESTTIEVSANNVAKQIKTLDIENSYCNWDEDDSVIAGCVNNRELDVDVTITNKEGLGTEDNEWYPLDEIEVEVVVDNKIDEKINDITIEWCLYDVDEDNCILDDKEDDFNLKDGDDKTYLINFQLDPDDLKGDSNNYIFYVKTYSDHKDYGENALSFEYSESIDIMRDDDFVILDKIQSPESAPCGEEIELTTKAWNIGSEKIDELTVRLYNKELGIDERELIGDLSVLRDEAVNFRFTLPKDVNEKTYLLELLVIDEDGDVYENTNEDEARFTHLLKVEGSCEAETNSDIQITAELSSETPKAVAGKQVIIDATIKNTGTERTTYTISLSGNSAWSGVGAIDPSTITLDAGESETLKIYLDINSDVTGAKEFKIVATYGDNTKEQSVSLDIEEGLSQGKIVDHLTENWFIYVIVLINLILIIAIIVAIRRIVARPAI